MALAAPLYRTKVNARDPAAYTTAVDEPYVVGALDSGRIYLDEVPAEGSVTITSADGLTVFAAITDPDAVLAANQYRVRYEGDLIAGMVEFAAAHDGQTVLVDSSEIGSAVYAHDYNGLASSKLDRFTSWTLGTDVVMGARVTGDAHDRLQVRVDSIRFGDGTAAPAQAIGRSSGGLYASTAWLPSATLTHALGSSAFRWNNVYSGGGDFSGNVLIGGTLGATGLATFSAGISIASGQWIKLGGSNRIYGDGAVTQLRAGSSRIEIANETGSDWGRMVGGILLWGTPGYSAGALAGEILLAHGKYLRGVNDSNTANPILIGIGGAGGAANTVQIGDSTRVIALGAIASYTSASAGDTVMPIGKYLRSDNGANNTYKLIGSDTQGFVFVGQSDRPVGIGGVPAAALGAADYGSLVITHGKTIRSSNPAGTATLALLGLNSASETGVGYNGGRADWNLKVDSADSPSGTTVLQIYANWLTGNGFRRINAAAAPPAGAIYLYLTP